VFHARIFAMADPAALWLTPPLKARDRVPRQSNEIDCRKLHFPKFAITSLDTQL